MFKNSNIRFDDFTGFLKNGIRFLLHKFVRYGQILLEFALY